MLTPYAPLEAIEAKYKHNLGDIKVERLMVSYSCISVYKK